MSDRATDGLQGRVASGLRWKIASQVTRQLTRLVVIVVIAHELPPREYGLAGMVLVFSTLVYVFADMALGSALVQRADLTDLDRCTVFWASAAIGLFFTLVAVVFAGAIGGFFGEPGVVTLLVAFAPTFLLTALGTVPQAQLMRALDFRSLEIRAMAATLVGAAVGIALAFAGAGAWAVIAQQLAIAAVSTSLVWVAAGWRPALRFSRARLNVLGAFGLRVFGSRLLFYLERNADNVLIGRVLGPAALGVYALSYNVMLVPLEQVGGPIADVLFPAFARVQDDLARLRAGWLRAVRMLAALVVPAMLLLIALAPDVVTVVFGARWDSATVVIQMLAWVGLHQSLQRFNSSVLEALGRTRPLLRYALVSSVVTFTSFVIGLHWGVVGVAASYAISSTLVAPMYLVLTARAAELPVRTFLTGVAPTFAAAGVAAAVAWLARIALHDAIAPAGVRLALLSALGAGVYLLLARWWVTSLRSDFRGMIPESWGTQARKLRPAFGPVKS